MELDELEEMLEDVDLTPYTALQPLRWQAETNRVVEAYANEVDKLRAETRALRVQVGVVEKELKRLDKALENI